MIVDNWWLVIDNPHITHGYYQLSTVNYQLIY